MNKYMKWIDKLKNNKLLPLGLFLILVLLMYGTLYSNVRPEKLDLQLFSIVKSDIISPITIEDVEATAQKRQEAAQDVKDQYVLKTDYAENRVEIISALFEAVSEVEKVTIPEVKEESETVSSKDEQEESVISTQPQPIPIDQQLIQLTEMIPRELSESLSQETLIALLHASPQQLDSARTTTITMIQQTMRMPIMVGEEEEKKQQVANEIKNLNLPVELRNAMTMIAQYSIIPNYVYDMKATEELRQLAMDEVNPVKIRAGQVLAKEGQVIDREIFKQLELVGLLEENTNPFIYLGLAIFVIVLTLIIAYYFQDLMADKNNRTTYLFIYVILFAITILLMKAISLFQYVSEIGYIFPIAMASMLIKMLINEKMALISSVIFAICGSLIFNVEMLGKFNFSIGVYLLLSGIAGTILLSNQKQRLSILKAGVFVSVLNIIVTAAIFMMRNGQYTSLEIGTYLTLALLSGFISAVLTLGLMPVFEAGFGILSSMKLIELSNPNHPLLRKILIEAPGTYHHSVMVANLAEAACEAVGANGLLARVGAYYHDIGKTKRPNFFIENQMNTENPHDKMAPQLSRTIIIAHPYDGSELLREHKIPKEIIDIAEQHHGTTLLKYFYFKAKEQADKEIDEADYRYPGPKAQTKESAIVGIADSVEAAVRSMPNPTPEKIEALVHNIVTDRLIDHQFDECDITLKELDIAAKSMCETLNGIFHSRIEYPELKDKKVKEA